MPNLIAALVCAVLVCMPAIADAHAVVTTESRISEITLVDVPILLAAALYGRGLFVLLERARREVSNLLLRALKVRYRVGLLRKAWLHETQSRKAKDRCGENAV
jgi:hypothetical protein